MNDVAMKVSASLKAMQYLLNVINWERRICLIICWTENMKRCIRYYYFNYFSFF